MLCFRQWLESLDVGDVITNPTTTQLRATLFMQSNYEHSVNAILDKQGDIHIALPDAYSHRELYDSLGPGIVFSIYIDDGKFYASPSYNSHRGEYAKVAKQLEAHPGIQRLGVIVNARA